MRHSALLFASTTLLLSACSQPGASSSDPRHYVTTHVAPTATSQGYDEHVAEEDGYTYRDNYTGVLGKWEANGRWSILFVGNSFTYGNETWNIFRRIADGQGLDVDVDSSTSGGWTLTGHANPKDQVGEITYGKLVSNKYNVVFLQDHSLRPIKSPGGFYDGVRAMQKLVDDNGARSVLFETWARKTGNADLEELGLTNETMTQKLVAGYAAIGEELGIPISHVGTAFYDVFTNHPEIELYGGDFYHASEIGSYLVSLVHFATVFGLSPIGVSYRYFPEGDERQTILEEAAYRAVFGESILKDEYKTSSNGVHE